MRSLPDCKSDPETATVNPKAVPIPYRQSEKRHLWEGVELLRPWRQGAERSPGAEPLEIVYNGNVLVETCCSWHKAIVVHGALIKVSVGLLSLKELLLQGPKVLAQAPWKSNWIWRV